MASVASGKISCTDKERILMKLQAEVALQEEVTRLAQTRLAMKTLEADIMSTSNRSVRSSSMGSPEILSPPMKVHRIGYGGGGPPDVNPDPDREDISSEHESYPSTVHQPSPSPSPAPPIVEEASATTSRVELPVSALNEETLIIFPLFLPQVEEFSIDTPAMSSVGSAFNAEKMLLAQQELLREEADAERLRLMQQGLLLERKKGLLHERTMVGANQERLRVVASKVQKQSEFNALNAAMAEQRIKEEESKVDAEYRAAENNIRNAELNLQEEAENARRRVRAERLLRGSVLSR